MNLKICFNILSYLESLNFEPYFNEYAVRNTPTYLFLSYTLSNLVNLHAEDNKLYTKVLHIYNVLKYKLENTSGLIKSYKVSLNDLTSNLISVTDLNNLCLYYYTTRNTDDCQKRFPQFLVEQLKLYNFEQLFNISYEDIHSVTYNNSKYKLITDTLFFTWIYTEVLQQSTITLCDNSDLNYEKILNLARKYYQQTNNKTSNLFQLQCYLVTHVIFCESHFGSKSLRNTSSIYDNNYNYQKELDFIINNFNQVKNLKLWEILAEFVFSLQILFKFQINKEIEAVIDIGQNQLKNHAITENGDGTLLKWNNIGKKLETHEHMTYCALVALIPANYRHQFMIDSSKDFTLNPSVTLQKRLLSEGYLFIHGALNYNNCSTGRMLVIDHLNSMGLVQSNQASKATIKKNISGLTVDIKSGELIGDTLRNSDNSSEQIKAGWMKLFNNDLFKILHSSSTIQAIFAKIFPHHDIEIISGETWMRIKGKGGKTREHSDYAYERDNTKIFSNPMKHTGLSTSKDCSICDIESNQSILICDLCGKSFHYLCNLNQYKEAINYTDISTHTIHQSKISQTKDNGGCWNCYGCSNSTVKPIYTVWISLSDINENSNSSILQVIPKSHLLGEYGLPAKTHILKSNQHNVISDDLPSQYTAEYLKSNNFISPSSLRCGDIVLFNCSTIHRATINESDEFRLSIDVRVKLHERRNNSIHRPNLPVKSKIASVPRPKKLNLNTRYFNAVAELNRIIMTNQTYNYEDNPAASLDLLSNFSSFMQPFIAVIQSFQSKDNKQLLTESIEQFNSLLSQFKRLLFNTHKQLSIYNDMLSETNLRYIEPQIRFVRRDKSNNYKNCNNIIFDWSHKLIIDHNIPNKGIGVKAAVDIPAWSAIRFYGEVIDKNTMEQRLAKGQCKHVFKINQNKYLDGNPDLDYLPENMAIAALINEPGPDEIVNCRWSKQGTDIIVIPFPIAAEQELLIYYGPNYTRDYPLGSTKI